MKLRWYRWAALAALFALLLDLSAFAGLRHVPQVGDAVASQARLESPLMHTYIVIGDQAWRFMPFTHGMSSGLSGAIWSDAYAAIRNNPELALHMLDSQSRGVMRACMPLLYWAPPVLFLFALIGWAFRPRKVSLMQQGG